MVVRGGIVSDFVEVDGFERFEQSFSRQSVASKPGLGGKVSREKVRVGVFGGGLI